MQVKRLDIIFPQHELPFPEVQNQYEALMIMVVINKSGIRCTLIDNG
jgi:hypothetical protein